MNRFEISLVISTYNKASRLELMLESILFQENINFSMVEIIIVDDGSNNQTKNLIDKYKAEFDLIYVYQQNKGRSSARNKGLELARGENIIFCDDDVILSRNFIHVHSSLQHQTDNLIIHGRIYELPFLKFFEDPQVGVIWPSCQGSEGSNLRNLNKYLIKPEDISSLKKIDAQKRQSLFEKNVEIILDRKIQHNQLEKLRFLGCVGANISGKKSMFETIGGFDVGFGKTWGGEDIELGYRLQQKGVEFKLSKEAFQYHITHLRENFKQSCIEANDFFYDKHGDVLIKDIKKLLLHEVKDLKLFCNMMQKGEDSVV